MQPCSGFGLLVKTEEAELQTVYNLVEHADILRNIYLSTKQCKNGGALTLDVGRDGEIMTLGAYPGYGRFDGNYGSKFSRYSKHENVSVTIVTAERDKMIENFQRPSKEEYFKENCRELWLSAHLYARSSWGSPRDADGQILSTGYNGS